jgi:hypothetical protein
MLKKNRGKMEVDLEKNTLLEELKAGKEKICLWGLGM